MAVLTHVAKPGDAEALPVSDQGSLFALKFTIDTSETNVSSGDVVKLLVPPANSKVQEIILNVTTAEGGTLTLDVGDYEVADDTAEDADGYLDGVDGNAVAKYSSNDYTLTEGAPNTVAPAFALKGKSYDGTDYIGVLFNNDADTAVIKVTALCVDVG